MRLSDGLIKECDFGVAIELAADCFASWTMVTWTYLFVFNGDQKAINEMVINKIEDCQQRLSYWQRLRGAANVAHKNGWILLSEQLPEVGKNVLVCDDDGDIYFSHRVNISQDKWAFYDEWGDKIKSLIAWCHLPEPYKAESEEKK